MTNRQSQLRMGLLSLIAFARCASANCESDPRDIHLNQEGFSTGSAKLAILVSDSRQPLAWKLADSAGDVRITGLTGVYGQDPVAGHAVHRIDFSGFNTPGRGYRLQASCAVSHPFEIGSDPFGRLPYDALAYFYHNRSGVPIEELYSGGAAWSRPAGHLPDKATCISGTDPEGNHWPGCDYTLDLTGGWYDAGDHGKYVVNGGIAVWTLLNLHEWQNALSRKPVFPDGSANLPESGNGISDLLDEARFEIEFLLRMQAPQGAVAQVPVGARSSWPGLEFTEINASGMAHHKIADREWTSLPMRPHEDPQIRVLHPVSTAATLNLAAVAAQCARIWRKLDAKLSNRCLKASRRAWVAARRNPEVYFIAGFSGSGLYGDDDVSDEFFWAAAELLITTGEAGFREHVFNSPHFRKGINDEHAWPEAAPLGIVSLALAGDAPGAEARRVAREHIIRAASRFRDERNRSGYHIPYATDQYRWGSNSNLLNRAMLLALAHDFTGERGYRDAVVDVMDYLLGRNPLGQSYISGYGEQSLTHPHHRFWAPSFDTGLPPPPPGALSGGPNSTNSADEVAREIIGKCAPQTCWRDDVRAFSLNEVAINWNAPLVWVAAWLAESAQ